MALREYQGGAKPTTVTGDFSSTATSFSVDDATGWPDGSVGPFTVVVNRTGATAEKMLATARTGTIPATITVPLANRGYDDTAAAQHFTGETVEHVATAEDMRDANAHIFDTTRDDHPQYVLTSEHTKALHDALGLDHGSLSGLADDDHANNLHVSAARALNDPIWTPVAVGDRILVFKALAGQTAAVTEWLDSANVVRASMDADFDFFAKSLRALGDDASLVVLDRDNAADRRAMIRFRQQGATKWSLGQDDATANLFVLYDEVDGQYQVYVTEYGIGLLGMAADFGGGRGVLGLKNADSAPVSNPTTGALLYSLTQVFRIRDSEGIKTPFGRELVDVKGDLIVGTAADTVGRLAVPANNKVHIGDSAQSTGYSTSDVAFGVLAGGYAARTTDQTGITDADVTDLSVTVTVAANRRIRLTWFEPDPQGNGGGDDFDLRLQEGATVLQTGRFGIPSANDHNRSVTVTAPLTPSAGSHTYKAHVTRTAGAGSLTLTRAADKFAHLLVEDIGPA